MRACRVVALAGQIFPMTVFRPFPRFFIFLCLFSASGDGTDEQTFVSDGDKAGYETNLFLYHVSTPL